MSKVKPSERERRLTEALRAVDAALGLPDRQDAESEGWYIVRYSSKEEAGRILFFLRELAELIPKHPNSKELRTVLVQRGHDDQLIEGFFDYRSTIHRAV